MELDFLFDGSRQTSLPTLVLAHGAGAGMDSRFMTVFAEGLTARGLRVARFEFPYMARRRREGRRRPPDRAPVLLDTWRRVIRQLGPPDGLVIGGLSMGGRIASMIADDTGEAGPGVAGLICFSYPFFTRDHPDRPRIEHLARLRTPALILQGERDPMGPRAIVDGYDLSDAITIHWLGDGDHGLRPRKKSGFTEEDNWNQAMDRAAAFVAAL